MLLAEPRLIVVEKAWLRERGVAACICNTWRTERRSTVTRGPEYGDRSRGFREYSVFTRNTEFRLNPSTAPDFAVAALMKGVLHQGKVDIFSGIIQLLMLEHLTHILIYLIQPERE